MIKKSKEWYRLKQIWHGMKNKNYEPSNCRWCTHKANCNNRISNKLVECNGKTQTIAEWADELKIEYGIVRGRIAKGWSIEKIAKHGWKPRKSSKKYYFRNKN